MVQAEPTTPAASSSQAGRPKTPDGKAATSNSSSLGCFGMGKTIEEAEKEEMPSGVVGLRNLGKCGFAGRFRLSVRLLNHPGLLRSCRSCQCRPTALPTGCCSCGKSMFAQAFTILHSTTQQPAVAAFSLTNQVPCLHLQSADAQSRPSS